MPLRPRALPDGETRLPLRTPAPRRTSSLMLGTRMALGTVFLGGALSINPSDPPQQESASTSPGMESMRRHQRQFKDLPDGNMLGQRFLTINSKTGTLDPARFFQQETPDGDIQLVLHMQGRTLALTDSVTISGFKKRIDTLITSIEKHGNRIEFKAASLGNSTCSIPIETISALATLLQEGKRDWGSLHVSYEIQYGGWLRFVPLPKQGERLVFFDIDYPEEAMIAAQ